jgi:hypothetical protein
MMNCRFILLILLGFNLSVVAQNLNINKIFPPAPAPKLENPFPGIRNGDMLVEDFNGDNIPDIIMMGGNNDYVNRATMYIGTGGGAYTEFSGSNLPVRTSSSYAAADVDGDGDLDVAVCGRTPSFGYETSLHFNNGSGVFTKAQMVPFINVSDGAVDFADVDGDGDQDLMVAGSNGLNGDSELYLNNGLGTFIASTTSSFPIMDDGDLDFTDVDGDNDQDLIMVGRSNMGNLYLAQLFINDGSGSFSLSTGNSFTGANDSESHFFDADADGDMDLVISGRANGNIGSTKLYMNDGLGNFSPGPDSNFIQVLHPAIASGDLNGDGFPELYISGEAPNLVISSQLLVNDGTGAFIEDTISDIDKMTRGTAIMHDMNGDTISDLILSGEKFGFMFQSIMFINDGSGRLYEAGGSYFEGLSSGCIDTADVDGDGDLDVFITGHDRYRVLRARLYLNNGTGGFTRSAESFEGVAGSDCEFNDVDLDGDQDLLVTGINDSSLTTVWIYRNNGSGNFTQYTSPTMIGVRIGDMELADTDGDGDDDLLLTGRRDMSAPSTHLYTNDGAGNFTQVSGTPFVALYNSVADFADIDNDGDQDLILSGRSSSFSRVTELYTNDGGGNFSLAGGQSFPGLSSGAVEFEDYDNDGDIDLFLSGQDGSSAPQSLLYKNDSSGNFILDSQQNIAGLFAGDAEWADLDGDGDRDLLLSGLDDTEQRVTMVYRNDTGLLAPAPWGSIRGTYAGQNLVADLDRDGAPEAILTGINNSAQVVAYRYEFGGCVMVSGTDSIVACDSLPWIDGNTYYTSNDTATYMLQTAAGCDSLVTLDLSIPKFNTSLLNAGPYLTSLDTISSYQWVRCSASGDSVTIIPGADSSSFLHVLYGKGYYAVILSQLGCFDTSACIYVDYQNIDEQGIIKSPMLFPNPTSGELQLDLGEEYQGVKLELYTLNGKLVLREVLGSGSRFTFDFGDLKGQFLLKLRSEEAVFRGMIIRLQ